MVTIGFPVDAISLYGESWAAVFFLVLLAKMLGNETRVYTVALIVAVLAPNPWSIYYVGVLMMTFRLIDIIRSS